MSHPDPGPENPPPPPGPPRLISVRTLAKSWDMSRQTIYKLIEAGELAIVNPPGHRGDLRIVESSAIDYITRNARRARKPSAA